jgi:hypothetical protein
LIERLLGLDFEGTQLSPEEIQSIIDGVTQEILDSEFLAELNQEIEALELEDLNLRTDVDDIVNDLNTEIARVDGIFGDLDDIDTAILNETTARINGDEAVAESVTGLASQYDNLSAQLLLEQQTRATADSAIVQTIQTLQTFSAKIFVQPTAPTIGIAPDNAVEGDLWYDSDDDNHPYTLLNIDSTLVWTSIRDGNFSVLQAQIQTEQTARIGADGALATQITDLTSVVASDKALVLSAIQDEATTRSTEDSALATTITNLTSTVNTNNTNTLAALSQEATSRANADSAISTTVNTLAAQVTTNNTNAFAAIQAEATARANADGAIASTVTTLTSTVDGNTASIQTAQSTIDGLKAEYSVKLDVNGYVTGYGQYNEGPGASGFIILADKFAVVTPGSSPVVPFTVTANGVFIKDAFIENLNASKINGQLVRDQLSDNIINGVKIENGAITADKIQANAITAVKIEANAITADKIQANAIDGKVITGSTLRTASSGSRVEIADDGTYLLWGGDGAKTDANSKFYIKKDGSAFFAGELVDGAASSSGYDVDTTTRNLTRNAENTVASVTIPAIAGKVISIQGIVSGTTYGAFGDGQTYSTVLRVKRNGTTIATKTLNGPYYEYEVVRFYLDNPGAGTFTYTMTVQPLVDDGDFPANPTLNVTYTALQTVQLRR